MTRARPRFVFDTNVLVSALLLEHSTPARALRLALRTGEILLSFPAVEEVSEVLSRKKLQRYFSPGDRDDFLESLVERAVLVEPDEEITVCRDPRDNKILELAVAGGAAYIVTGDKDLRVLHPFRGIAILTPGDLLDRKRWL